MQKKVNGTGKKVQRRTGLEPVTLHATLAPAELLAD